MRKDCIAETQVVELLQPYVSGLLLTVYREHYGLCSILSITSAPGTVAHEQLHFSELQQDFGHRATIKHQAADAASRLLIYSHDRSKLDDILLPLMVGPVRASKIPKCGVKLCHILYQVFKTTLSELLALPTIVSLPTQLTNPKKAGVLANNTELRSIATWSEHLKHRDPIIHKSHWILG